MMENELFLFFFFAILYFFLSFFLHPPPPSSTFFIVVRFFTFYFFILGSSFALLFVCVWCRQKQTLDFYFPLFTFAKPSLFHLMACTSELNESREIFSTPRTKNK